MRVASVIFFLFFELARADDVVIPQVVIPVHLSRSDHAPRVVLVPRNAPSAIKMHLRLQLWLRITKARAVCEYPGNHAGKLLKAIEQDADINPDDPTLPARLTELEKILQ